MEESQRKYAFPLAVKQPSIVPYLIAGEDAQRFLDDFNRFVDSEYGGNKNLKVLSVADINKVPVVVSSNTLVLPIAQRLVPERRVGRPEDLQRTLNDGDTIGIRGNYCVDMGVVLNFSGRDHDLAVDFYEQLPKELRSFDRLPSVVVGYDLKNSDKGNFGLGLVYADGTQVRTAKILAQPSGNFSDVDVSLETGLPSKLGNGERRLYTNSQREQSKDNLGLSRLYLYRNLDIYSSGDDLAYSNDRGRVVLF